MELEEGEEYSFWEAETVRKKRKRDQKNHYWKTFMKTPREAGKKMDRGMGVDRVMAGDTAVARFN